MGTEGKDRLEFFKDPTGNWNLPSCADCRKSLHTQLYNFITIFSKRIWTKSMNSINVYVLQSEVYTFLSDQYSDSSGGSLSNIEGRIRSGLYLNVTAAFQETMWLVCDHLWRYIFLIQICTFPCQSVQ
jgi:hypothetical protein